MKVSIVIPAYNEAMFIKNIIAEVINVIKGLDIKSFMVF